MQAVPIYISEMAPHKYRGALNIIFQLMTTLGIVLASLINYCEPLPLTTVSNAQLYLVLTSIFTLSGSLRSLKTTATMLEVERSVYRASRLGFDIMSAQVGFSLCTRCMIKTSDDAESYQVPGDQHP